MMAGRLPEADLSCSICCEVFRDPVVLKCSHSFCSPCLQQYWSIRTNRDCPLCRRQSLDDPVPSLVLKNLCESYLGENDDIVVKKAEEPCCDPEEMCPIHGEKFKLFCTKDSEPICVVCHTSRKHKQHECFPVSEAVADVREKMTSALSSLQDKKEAFERLRKNYENTAAYIQVQARFVETQTHAEFEKLRSFLRAEEEMRMQALKREEEQRSRAMAEKIQEITKDLTSVSECIQALEGDLALDGISVLHNCKKTLARSSKFSSHIVLSDFYSSMCNRLASAPHRAAVPIQDPVMQPGALIDVAKYVGSLSFHVWDKMQKIVKYTPVTLDPNTAAPWLVLSDDLTSISDSKEKQKLPNNPERYDPDTGVLGREGFTTGKHAWDVSVGDNTAWVVGVAKASVTRKKKVSSVLKNGYLCIYFYHKMYFAGTSPLTRLNLRRNPEKVRVQLDCDRSRVSFYDLQDNTHIYTFKHAIAERVFPYFWVGCQQCPLTIQPLDVSVVANEIF